MGSACAGQLVMIRNKRPWPAASSVHPTSLNTLSEHIPNEDLALVGVAGGGSRLPFQPDQRQGLVAADREAALDVEVETFVGLRDIDGSRPGQVALFRRTSSSPPGQRLRPSGPRRR